MKEIANKQAPAVTGGYNPIGQSPINDPGCADPFGPLGPRAPVDYPQFPFPVPGDVPGVTDPPIA